MLHYPVGCRRRKGRPPHPSPLPPKRERGSRSRSRSAAAPWPLRGKSTSVVWLRRQLDVRRDSRASLSRLHRQVVEVPAPWHERRGAERARLSRQRAVDLVDPQLRVGRKIHDDLRRRRGRADARRHGLRVRTRRDRSRRGRRRRRRGLRGRRGDRRCARRCCRCSRGDNDAAAADAGAGADAACVRGAAVIRPAGAGAIRQHHETVAARCTSANNSDGPKGRARPAGSKP